MMHFRGIQCPSLHVKNFVVTISGKKIAKCSQWTAVPAKFSAFDYVAHASQQVESSDEEDA